MKGKSARWKFSLVGSFLLFYASSIHAQVSLVDTLNIILCGRIDAGKHSKEGLQNTYWMDAEVKEGSVLHWHVFGVEYELHEHNVVNAQRQFPVRCVRSTQ